MNYRNIAVFCGSALGDDKDFETKAIEIARGLADRGCNLVYGGGCRGIMGVFAKTMKEAGCHTIGVTPKRFLKANTTNSFQSDEHYVVETMQERKMMMYDKADAFIIFPGGIGTLDELAEVISRKYLGFHGKPIVIFNLNGFYDGLKTLFNSMENAGYMAEKDYFEFAETPEQVFDYLERTPSFVGAHEGD